ncbi:MAG: leucine-rich repeat domain-containing protein, partial [Spirochaetales bacterium]|nr:leucine-rich repeat domain-containing protein [Spirochaetales bacterium]
IPDGVTIIGSNAFANSRQGREITSVTLPANVQLGDSAFDTMSRLYTRDSLETVYNKNGKKAGTHELQISWSDLFLTMITLQLVYRNTDEWVLVE